ncbi:MAG: hypothetical protein U5R31_11555 [Acidimicrobiia bacterium]|nr:hypothetical protein [Acidimicrobiia bacterium]
MIEGNSHWAGISLFGSGWSIVGNRVVHPATDDGQPYQRSCRGGPNGVRSAAILLCQVGDDFNDVTVNNRIEGNRTIGWYGILLIGHDEGRPYWAPRNNRLRGNDAFGSYHGYADDFRPGQWFGDRNDWVDHSRTHF